MNYKNKKKRYLAVFSLLITPHLMAAPLESLEDSWYVGGAIGQSRLEPEGDNWNVDDNKDLSKKVYGGVNIGRNFGLEMFWNDLGVAKVSHNKTNAQANVAYKAYGGNLVYHVPSYLGDIHPIVKLGVAKLDTKGEGAEVNQKNKFAVMGGLGAEYQLSQGFRVRAEYELFDKDIDQLSVGLNWRPVLTRRPIEAPKTVVKEKAAESPRPIVIVNQPPTTPTIVKQAPVPVTPPVVRTIVKHVPVPTPKPQPKVVHKTLAGGSNFATNSAVLTSAGRLALDRMASDLLRDGVVIHNIAIIGHTDNVGSHIANQALSQRRAQSVANYLVSRGLSRQVMTVVGRGETQPIASNATAAGRMENRRVKIIVKGSQTIQN
ncbi:MAG: hypothetical protein CSB48_00750 [Proteobacteria bacterium]|nr:MAG: hypothetical protein CSB48_00750 [Pseudomonadota bacterium]